MSVPLFIIVFVPAAISIISTSHDAVAPPAATNPKILTYILVFKYHGMIESRQTGLARLDKKRQRIENK